MAKLIKCKSCDKDIATSAKKCPSCGAKNKKPFYKRPGVIIIAVLLVIIGIGSTGESDSSSSGSGNNGTPQEEIVYQQVTVDELIDTLNANALNASTTYKNTYVTITGQLSNIDSSGKYFSISPLYDEWSFDTIMCYIKNDEQINKVANFTSKQTVVLSGKITDVGEIMGYSLDIIEIH